MEISKHKEIKYELISEDGLTTHVLNKQRSLIGSGESCDLVISDESIEGVHAVIELIASGIRVYDMNTISGSYVNGEMAIVKDAKPGDKIGFANCIFTLDSFDAAVLDENSDIPPILMNLDNSDIVPIAPKRINKVVKKSAPRGSFDKVELPLANYAKADSLEYIFELPENIENVLHYDNYQKSIEVTITIGANVFSIEYMDAELSKFCFVGGINGEGLTLPYLGKNEKVTFLENKANKYFIHKVDGFDFLNLSDNKDNNEFLEEGSLIVFMSDQIKVFVRLSEAPPKTLVQPFIKNDRIFWKYFAFVISAVVIFLLFVGIMDVNEELKEKKAPQKLASILYKKPVLSISVDKTKKKNKKIAQKSPSRRKKKAKVAKNKTFSKKKKSKSIAPKKAAKAKSPTKNKVVRKSRPTKSKGNIDTYKAVDFSASLPSVLSKSSNLDKIENEQQNDFKYKADSPSAKNTGENIKLSEIDSANEDFSKSASKNLEDTGALSNFQNDKTMATAGIPSRTIVLGGMDPDTIRRILMDHLPQFRFCYQKELDKSNKEFSGRITLNFVIGASGYVTRAGVKESSMPAKVKGCVVNVLKGIPFPSPRGGGVVEVTQPMNFYPKE